MSDFSEKLTQSPETGEPVGDFKTTPVEAEFTSLPAKTKGKLKVKKTSKAPFKKNDSREDSLFDLEGELTVDIFETEKNIVIQSAIAGIDADDLDISIEKDMVAIKGKREKCLEEKVENYF
ncbi:MAG: Hsp20 family protein, partial [bacterium]|nr:Hsp20 family protein [bacterium]